MFKPTPSSPHLFCVYAHDLLGTELHKPSSLITLRSPELTHRLITVLRLEVGEQVQLFSHNQILIVELEKSPRPKDTIVGRVLTAQRNTPAHTNVYACIGLLKKESFEEAVHHAAVTGATHIVPLVTTKSRKGWLNEREAERLTPILIAACEQSKNYQIPLLLAPQTIEKHVLLLKSKPSLAIGFESTGKPFTALLATMQKTKTESIHYFIGPEGGFTPPEIALLEETHTDFYTLIPTILRSQEAVCVAGGLIAALTKEIS